MTWSASFISGRYDEDWWVGSIKDILFENEDFLVAFMHPKVRARTFIGRQHMLGTSATHNSTNKSTNYEQNRKSILAFSFWKTFSRF